MQAEIEGITVKTVKGDISEIDVDAIVNAANSDLWMGSGVAGAIKRKGGVEIEREALKQGPIKPGEAIITGAGVLRAKYVIHCAGMPPGGSATAKYVESSVVEALKLAHSKGLGTVAIPAIGAGVGGLSHKESIYAILRGLSRNKSHGVDTVFLVGYGDAAKVTIDKTVEEYISE